MTSEAVTGAPVLHNGAFWSALRAAPGWSVDLPEVYGESLAWESLVELETLLGDHDFKRIVYYQDREAALRAEFAHMRMFACVCKVRECMKCCLARALDAD